MAAVIVPTMKPLVKALMRIINEPFDPLSLFANGENGLWTSQMDLSTLYLEAAGTTQVSADGDPEGLIVDKSGNGNDGSQSTTSLKPTFRTNGTANWAEYAGDLIDHGALTGIGACTYFFAVRTSKTEAQTYIDGITGGSGSFLLVTQGGSSSEEVSSGYGAVTIRVDGVEQISPTRGSLATAICDGNWHVVEIDAASPIEQTYIGGKNDVKFVGDLGETIIAEGITDEKRVATRQYIADIYGVTL